MKREAQYSKVVSSMIGIWLSMYYNQSILALQKGDSFLTQLQVAIDIIVSFPNDMMDCVLWQYVRLRNK